MKISAQLAIISTLVFYSGSSIWGMEPVTLQLKWLHQFQFAGYYAAIEQGYYAEEGLEVTLVEAQPDKNPMQTVIDGDADYGVSTSDILRLRAEVMMQGGRADLLSLLKEEQVPLDQIEFVPHDFSYDSLIKGKVQAFSGYITNEPFSLQAAGAQPMIFSPQAVGIDFYGDSLFTTEAQIKEHPEQVEAFRRASLRGWDYALDHPEEIIDLILAKYSQRKSKAELTFEAQKTRELIRPDLIEIGHMNPKRWEHIKQVLREEGMLQEPVEIHDMLYKYEAKFPLTPFLQVLGTSLLCISLLGAFGYRQAKLRRQLEEEIERRKRGDQSLLQREAEYRNLYNNAPMAFIVLDTELRIREWNHEAENLFGWKAEEVIGTLATDFLLPDSANEKVDQAKKACLGKKKNHSQINENLTKDGRIIWCKWYNVARLNSEGKTIEFHSIASDATDEINEHNRFEQERAQALGASEAKDQLLAQTSHEIRNPLNAIMGFTQLIHEDAQDDETKEMAGIIMDGAESMLNILNDLLDSAKITAGKMEVHWEEINLATLVAKEVKLFSQLIRKQGLECNTTIEKSLPIITSDSRCIEQILNNLISVWTESRECSKNGS